MKNTKIAKNTPKTRRAPSVRSGKEITPSKPTKPCKAAVGGKNAKQRSVGDASGQLIVAEGNRTHYLLALREAVDGLELHASAFDLKLRSLGNKVIGAAGIGERDVLVSGELVDLATRLLELIGKNLEARPVRSLGVPLAVTSTLIDRAVAIQNAVYRGTARTIVQVERETEK